MKKTRAKEIYTLGDLTSWEVVAGKCCSAHSAWSNRRSGCAFALAADAKRGAPGLQDQDAVCAFPHFA